MEFIDVLSVKPKFHASNARELSTNHLVNHF